MDVKPTYAAAIADYLLAHGIAKASLRPLAQAAGTSDRMLVYHFKDKPGILRTGLDVIVARNIAALDETLPEEPLPAEALMMIVGSAAESGVFDLSFAVFFELAAMARRGDKDAQQTGRQIAQHFHDWLVARLTEPERAGELLGAIEGWGLLTAVGLDLPFPKG